MTRLARVFLLTVLCFTVATISSFASDLIGSELGKDYIHPSRTGKAFGPATSLAEGDPYHNGITLLCSQCHVMHTSLEHPHEGQTLPDPFGPYPQQFTASPQLLKASDPVALCLACHDNVGGIPDVVGPDVNGLTQRSAGLFELPGEDNPRGHKLEYGLDESAGFGMCMRCHFGGTFETAAVSCIDCHNPHGNLRSRNLQWASDPGGEPQFGLIVNPAATGMAKYEQVNVGYGTTNNVSLREVTNMCIDCHHVFSGGSYIDPDGDGIHSLHPTYDSERGSLNFIGQGETKGSTDPAHWEAGTGAGFVNTARLRFVNNGATDFTATQTIDASVNGVFCLSCHRAHGGMNAFALQWDPTDVVNGEGCDQCHYKTGT